MENSILYMLRRYWYLIIIALLVSAPLCYLGFYRTDQALILKGGAKNFDDVVEIETDYKISGSFSTLYVITMNHSTKLQNIITKNDPTIERYTMSTGGSSGASDIDSWKASKIQYDSSIYSSLILAYNEANKINNNIKISYSFKGFQVTDYPNNSKFKIGDMIIKIKSQKYNNETFDISDEMKFREVINSTRYVGDIYTIIRDNKEMELVLEANDGFYAYSIYDINKDLTYPKFNINNSVIGGPSGGLLQTLSIYDRLTGLDLTKGKKIAGTGTISYNGRVGAIGGIKEKIPTAVDNHIDIFFCPSVNYDDALASYNSLPNSSRMKLVKIDTFYDALNYLRGEQ